MIINQGNHASVCFNYSFSKNPVITDACVSHKFHTQKTICMIFIWENFRWNSHEVNFMFSTDEMIFWYGA